jgi:DNA polymerase-3 subunit delta'
MIIPSNNYQFTYIHLAAENKNLIGFESIKSTLLNAYSNKKLHHAILLNGKKGIGKASFAKEIVLEILGEIPEAKNALHPDLLLIEKEAEKREITVDKIRKIADFLNQTAAISPNKFIIINSACELNKSAANALLKILEEPHPNNFLILVSHNLSQVLPTIKSRCQILKISDLTFENFCQILRRKKPTISDEELKFLSDICDNSPAEAINIGSDITRLYELLLNSFKEKKISEELLKKISDKNFSFIILKKIFEFFFNRSAKFSSGFPLNFYFTEEEIFLELIKKFPPQKLFQIFDESLILLSKTTSLNLDKKLTFINIFNRISY